MASRFAGYGCCLAPFLGATAYEISLLLWPWRSQRVATSEGDAFDVNCKRRPPPIGCCLYPASRVLLEWCLLEPLPKGARVLEIGSGTGSLAIGLSRARPDVDLTATDNCHDALTTLRANVEANGARVRVLQLDAAAAMRRECDAVLAADIAYAGGFEGSLQGATVRVVQVDRWSGGAFAGLAAAAGETTSSHTRDPRLVAFERNNPHLAPVAPDVREKLRRNVFAALPWPDRLAWHLLGTFDAMYCYQSSE